jgi:hypothetical protein
VWLFVSVAVLMCFVTATRGGRGIVR